MSRVLRSWKAIGYLSREEIFNLQSAKLRKFLTEQLYPFSPYYHRLLKERGIDVRKFRDLGDLANYPFTSKEDLIPTPENPTKSKEFVLAPDRQKIQDHWPVSRKLKMLGTKLIHGEDQLQERLQWEYRPV